MNNPECDILDTKKTEILDKIAGFIVKKGLSVIAVMFLESTRPLHYLGSQSMLFFEPFLTILISGEKLQAFREAMEDKRYVDYLLNKIEELEN